MNATRTRPPRNFADAVRRLAVPLHRIRWTPPAGTATEADAVAANARGDGPPCELIDGTLVEKAMSVFAVRLATILVQLLEQYTLTHPVGFVFADGLLTQLAAGRARMPDVWFVSRDRLPGRRLPNQSVAAFTPDLAVEILSPSNTRREMAQKRREYFAAGARLVWEIDPEARTAVVYTSPTDSTALDVTGFLDGGTVLPGFAVPVAELFTRLDGTP